MRHKSTYTWVCFKSQLERLVHVFLDVLLGIYLPPEFFAEMFRLSADALEIIEVFGRNALENFPQVAHGELWKIVIGPGVVQMFLEKAHELASFGLSRFFEFEFCGEEVADALHTFIVRGCSKNSRYKARVSSGKSRTD